MLTKMKNASRQKKYPFLLEIAIGDIRMSIYPMHVSIQC